MISYPPSISRAVGKEANLLSLLVLLMTNKASVPLCGEKPRRNGRKGNGKKNTQETELFR